MPTLCVTAENAVAFYLALGKAKVPAVLHNFQPSKRGVGQASHDPSLTTELQDPHLDPEKWLPQRVLPQT